MSLSINTDRTKIAWELQKKMKLDEVEFLSKNLENTFKENSIFICGNYIGNVFM